MRRILISTFMLFTLSQFLVAQSALDNRPNPALSGQWTIHWIVNGQQTSTHNTLEISGNKDALGGNFKSDSGENCPISGSYSDGIALLHLRCAKFNIDLHGQLKGLELDGQFTESGNSKGLFRMEKSTCWLPEGCGNY